MDGKAILKVHFTYFARNSRNALLYFDGTELGYYTLEYSHVALFRTN